MRKQYDKPEFERINLREIYTGAGAGQDVLSGNEEEEEVVTDPSIQDPDA